MERIRDSIVGRERELASLTEFLEAVSEGPIALVLNGDQGIGKTTLWRHAVQLGRERGYDVLACRPGEAETRLPYAGLGDLLRDVSDAELATLPGTQRRAMEIALLRTDQEGPPLQQRAVSVALLGILSRLAERGPVLVAVDDAQWLDSPTARVLQFALRRLGPGPIAILVSARSAAHNEDPFALAATLPTGRVRFVRVSPLGLDDIDHLLRSRLANSLARSTLRRIHQISGGNPFFAIEMGRALIGRGDVTVLGDELPIPETLRELVLDRLFRLPGTVRDVLLVIAALARPTVDLVEAAAGPGVQAEAAIFRAVQAGVLELDGRVVRFSHPLLGSVLYAETSAPTKRGLHARLARIAPDPEEQAQHLALAAVGPDPVVADALDDAAQRARFRGASDAAAGLAEWAVRITPPEQGEMLLRRKLNAAEYHFATGEADRAQVLFEEARASSPPGPIRADALLGLGRIWARGSGLPHAQEVLQEALGYVGADALRGSLIEGWLAWVKILLGDVGGARPHATKALLLAEQSQDRRALVEALTTLSEVRFLEGGGIPDALLARALEMEEWAHDLPFERHPGAWRAAMLKWAGETDAARQQYLIETRRIEERGEEIAIPIVAYSHSELECWAGDWDRAEQLATLAWEASLEPEQEAVHAYALYARSLVDAHRGRIESARASAQEGLALAQRTATGPGVLLNASVLGFVELSIGNPTVANAILGPLAAALPATGIVEPGVFRFLPDEIEALTVLGELDRAESLLTPFEQKARELRRTWAIAAACRCRAELSAARGNMPGAVAAASEALDEIRRLSQPFDLARTLLVMGQIQRREKKRRAARQSLDEALAIFERLGAPLWSAKARAEVGRIGGRPSTLEGLTPTEGRVAELAAAGYSNREIAETLFLSVKTVETNLTRIYQKLGVASRRDLARRSRAGNLPDFVTSSRA